mmetsp:Transcript_8206/g.34826  ORF Transcript_8206/g.34826 Transcript_8206/m.34826 type:complete len:280 (+) Transcript_8206:104-943(+)
MSERVRLKRFARGGEVHDGVDARLASGDEPVGALLEEPGDAHGPLGRDPHGLQEPHQVVRHRTPPDGGLEAPEVAPRAPRAVRVDGLVPRDVRGFHQVLLLQNLKPGFFHRRQHFLARARGGQPVADQDLLADPAVLGVGGVVLVRQAPLVRREHAAGFQHARRFARRFSPHRGRQLVEQVHARHRVEGLVREGHGLRRRLHELAAPKARNVSRFFILRRGKSLHRLAQRGGQRRRRDARGFRQAPHLTQRFRRERGDPLLRFFCFPRSSRTSTRSHPL